MRLSRLLLPVAALLIAFLASAGGALASPSEAAAPAAVTAPATQAARASSLELGIVRELNRVRAQNGLRPVVISPQLAVAALGHSISMIESGVFDHTSADGTTFDKRVLRSYPVRGYAAWTVGENLLYDASEIDAAAAVQAWMDSPAHRANMLNRDYREVGIGALQTTFAPGDFGDGPALVITLDFGARTVSTARAGHGVTRVTASR